MLEKAVHRYQNRAIEAAQVIEELIQLAKDMRAANARGEALGLNDEELAFYDALETNDSAVKVLGDETLRTIARELVETVRRNVTIDWGLSARTCAPSCACSSSGSCESTAIRRTSRRRQRGRSSNRLSCCRRGGQQRDADWNRTPGTGRVFGKRADCPVGPDDALKGKEYITVQSFLDGSLMFSYALGGFLPSRATTATTW